MYFPIREAQALKKILISPFSVYCYKFLGKGKNVVAKILKKRFSAL
jgi:hypothetical protein